MAHAFDKTLPKQETETEPVSWQDRMRIKTHEGKTAARFMEWEYYTISGYQPLSVIDIIADLERLHILYGTDAEGFWCHDSPMLAPGHKASICERLEELTRYAETETYYYALSPPMGFQRFPTADTLRDLRGKRLQSVAVQPDRGNRSGMEAGVLGNEPLAKSELGSHPLSELPGHGVGQNPQSARMRVLSQKDGSE